MALAELIAALEVDVNARIAAIRGEAKSTADRMTREAADRAAARRTSGLAEVERAAKAAAALEVARARRTARRERIVARDRVLRSVLAQARTALPRLLQATEYRETLPAQIATALSCADATRAVRIRCSPSITHDIERFTAAAPAITVEPDATVGSGFMLSAEEGRVEIDATLEARMGQLHRELAIVLLRALDADSTDALG